MRDEKTSKPSSPFLNITETDPHPPDTVPQTGVEQLVQQIKETADKLAPRPAPTAATSSSSAPPLEGAALRLQGVRRRTATAAR